MTTPNPALTERDQQILDLLALGVPTSTIAGKVHLSYTHTKSLISALCRQIGVGDRVATGVWWRDKTWTDEKRRSMLNSEEVQRFIQGIPLLSPRERQILDALVDQPNPTLKEIGGNLGIAGSTVKTYLNSIVEKCHVHHDSGPVHRRSVITTMWSLVRPELSREQ